MATIKFEDFGKGVRSVKVEFPGPVEGPNQTIYIGDDLKRMSTFGDVIHLEFNSNAHPTIKILGTDVVKDDNTQCADTAEALEYLASLNFKKGGGGGDDGNDGKEFDWQFQNQNFDGITRNYICPMLATNQSSTGGTSALNVGETTYHYFKIDTETTFDLIQFNIRSGTSPIASAIYNLQEGTMLPAQVLHQFALPVTAPGIITFIFFTPLVLPKGTYAWAKKTQGGHQIRGLRYDRFRIVGGYSSAAVGRPLHRATTFEPYSGTFSDNPTIDIFDATGNNSPLFYLRPAS